MFSGNKHLLKLSCLFLCFCNRLNMFSICINSRVLSFFFSFFLSFFLCLLLKISFLLNSIHFIEWFLFRNKSSCSSRDGRCLVYICCCRNLNLLFLSRFLYLELSLGSCLCLSFSLCLSLCLCLCFCLSLSLSLGLQLLLLSFIYLGHSLHLLVSLRLSLGYSSCRLGSSSVCRLSCCISWSSLSGSWISLLGLLSSLNLSSLIVSNCLTSSVIFLITDHLTCLDKLFLTKTLDECICIKN